MARVVLIGIVLLSTLAVGESQTLYVDASASPGGDGSSWSNAMSNLSEALEQASSGWEVRVAQGIYVPTLPAEPIPQRRTFEVKNGVSLVGGYAGLRGPKPGERDPATYVTTLSGDRFGDDVGSFTVNRDDNVFTVVTVESTPTAGAPPAVIVGFTICAGHSSPPPGPADVGDRRGAAIYAPDTALRVSDCRFEANFARDRGGAIYLRIGVGGFFDIRNSTFIGNVSLSSGGAISAVHTSDERMAIVDCAFVGNQGDRFAVTVGGPADVVRCSFESNEEGGLAVSGNEEFSPRVVSCRFIGNRSWRALQLGGVGEVDNCFFSGNEDTALGLSGDGIANVRSCTIINNFGDGGGGIRVAGSVLRLANSIIWANDSSSTLEQNQVFIDPPSGVPTFDSCLIEGWTGTYLAVATTGQNPLLAGPLGADGVVGTGDDDPTVLPGSPALDAGNNELLAVDTVDLDDDGVTDEAVPHDLVGALRVQPAIEGGEPIVDIGAVEAVSISAPTGLRGDSNSDGIVDVADGVYLLSFLFLGGDVPDCDAACDFDSDQSVHMADALAIFQYQLLDGAPPSAPFPSCGSLGFELPCAPYTCP